MINFLIYVFGFKHQKCLKTSDLHDLRDLYIKQRYI